MKKWIVGMFLLLFAMPAQGSFLQIVGDPDLKFSIKDNKTQITGSLELKNEGDEPSPEVTAILKIGQWHWVGLPVKLDQKAKNLWTISDEVELNKLACPKDSLCKDLPLKGRFPALLQRTYRDLNLYGFSSPSILFVDIGELTADERARLMNPQIVGKMELQGDGTVFKGSLELRNLSQKAVDVFIDTFTSNELQLATKAQVIKIPPSASRQVDIEVESFSGIVGSSYPVYAYFQWVDGDLRNSNFSVASILIKKTKKVKSYMVIGLLGLVTLGGIALWFAFRRKRT